jgi:hypothetical protein
MELDAASMAPARCPADAELEWRALLCHNLLMLSELYLSAWSVLVSVAVFASI